MHNDFMNGHCCSADAHERACLLCPMQVVTVIAVQRGYTDWVDPDQITKYLTRAFSFVQAAASQALSEIRSTRMLTAAAEKGIETALKDLNKVLQTQGVQL
jgi:F0F1-type ATP synthase alpha subunit